MSNIDIIEKPTTAEQEKLVQSQFNTNVAFFVHLKAYNNSVREELEKRLTEVFFFKAKDCFQFFKSVLVISTVSKVSI